MPTPYLAGLCGLLVLALVDLTPGQAADKPKDLIIGKWMPVKEKEKKGTLQFTPDGKLLVRVKGPDSKEIEVNGTFKFLDENTMEVVLSFKGETRKEKLKVKVTRDEMTTTDSSNKTDTFRRIK